MYVKSIVLDGFKSYGQRTEISGFDDQFNAITGLNGSGKSNILDAICFVLGISNLTQVRASNLQDLIYKSGQAGVNKATVSITFDNTNPEQSPPTFERVSEITITRQIVIGGKNKYMINGTTVQNKKVQDLFCSIQLNVNNPHFLIMQGKVTKVLNMKPCDILAMIEEAAGTKMYETKKQSAQKTIVKKDAKLKELDAIVKEEITPKLDKLRKERALYVEYRTVEREIEQMLGIYQAWEYFYSQKAVLKAAQILEKGQAKIHCIEENIGKNQERIQQIDEEIEELQNTATTEASEALKKIEAELKETEKIEAKATSKLKSIQDNITKEERKKTQLEKNLVDDSKALKSKEDELGKVQALFETLKEKQRADSEALALSEKKFEALSAGMEVNEAGEAETLRDQLMKFQQEAAQARTDVTTATGRVDFCQKSLKEKQRGLGSSAADYERDRVDLDKLQKEVKNLETSLGKVNYSEERMNDLENNRQIWTREIRVLKDRTERFEAQRPQSQFRYTDPESNFQRQRVHGVVCRLIDVKDPIANIAIETAAGGRLYNVVIDSDATGKKLLQRGNLQNRTTFIPLNKIQSNAMSNSIINKAQRLVGEENVQSAISHLNYDPRHQSVMDFIFGNVLICRDLNTAKQVAFHPQIQRKCVTLDGDVVDPAGTLSGGAPQKGGSVLAQLKEILQFEEQLQVKEQEINKVIEEIRKMSVFQDQYATLKQKLEMKLQDVNLLTQRLQQTKHHRMQEEIDNLASEIAQLKEKIQTCQAIEATSKQKIKELENKMKTTNKENQLKEAESEMKKLKQKADKSKKEWDNKEKAYDALNMEIEVLKKELEKLREQIQACEDSIKELKQQHAEESQSTKEIKDSVKKFQAQVKAGKAAIAEKNKDIQKRLQQKEELAAQITEFNLKIKEHNHELKKLSDDVKNSEAREQDCRRRIKKDNAYLKDAEKMSDEEGRNLEKKIRTNQEKKNKLSRTVNAKAQSMFEQEEQQYNDMRRKQKIVQEDKIKIISVIADLDKKKEHILSVAYEQISKDFGSIFSTLLPGANAKLLPPPGQTILQGLEVKVSLGGVWKESLTELSGGQRSLAALSLILSMLLFKPAPLYILDEVDAALDLSHTQNIGNMLKSHFKKSQFIIVSLKDGMFNNANVLFRTKFVDGVSTINRTVNRN